jgi:hypothetical protein
VAYLTEGAVSAQAGSVDAKQARPASVDPEQDERPKGILARLRRAGLTAAMSVVGLNIWTGNPLLALWVGSRVVGAQGTISMGAVALVAVMMLVVGVALAQLLGMLGLAYDRLTGRQSTVSKHAPWLRSMRGERVQYERSREGLTTMELILVVMVVVAVAAFEIWFFFFSTSPIDQRSGR